MFAQRKIGKEIRVAYHIRENFKERKEGRGGVEDVKGKVKFSCKFSEMMHTKYN